MGTRKLTERATALCVACTNPEFCGQAIGYGQKTICEAEEVSAPIVDQGPLRSGNVLPEDDSQRGLYPMAEGCLDYFPNALAEVSRISYEGNQKHNPGEPMGWARAKSTDHRNKIIRHTVDSREDTEAAIEHAAQAAWRALAHLQTKIETVRGIRQSPASR